MLYNEICFAYKLPFSNTQTITLINFQLFYQKTLQIYASTKIQTLADNQWHYICVDLYQAYLAQNSGTYSKLTLTTYQVNFSACIYLICLFNYRKLGISLSENNQHVN